MAVFNEQESRRRADEEASIKQQRRMAAHSRFGEGLGNAFLNYTYGRENYSSNWQNEQAIDRSKLAEEVVKAFESSKHDDKVKAITAILEGVDYKIQKAEMDVVDSSSIVL